MNDTEFNEIVNFLKNNQGGNTITPTTPTYTPPKQSVSDYLSTSPSKLDIMARGMNDQAAAIRNIPVLKQAFDFATQLGVGYGKPHVGLITKTTQLASDFTSKILGNDNPVSQFMSNRSKDLQFLNENIYKSENVGNTDESISGKTGQALGTAYAFYKGGKTALGKTPAPSLPGFSKVVVADTLLGTGLTGSVEEGAKTGLISALSGGLASVPNISSLFKGNKLSQVKDITESIKPVTKTKMATNFIGNVGSNFLKSYPVDVASKLAAGEENPYTPGIQSLIGTGIGVYKGVGDLKQDLRQKKLQNIKSDTTLQAAKAFQGNEEQSKKIVKAVSDEFTIDEIKKAKTADDYITLAQQKIDEIKKAKIPVLEKSPIAKPLEDLSINAKVTMLNGTTKDVPTNYVKQALKQLRDYFRKEAPEKLAIIDDLEKKKVWTSEDVENLAVLHGKEISNNAYKPDGTLSTGVTKLAVNNTRNGLKSTSREMSQQGSVLSDADNRISNLIVVKKLAEDMKDKVLNFEKSVKEITTLDVIKHPLRNIAYGLKFAVTKMLSELASGNTESKLNPRELQKRMNGLLVDLKTVVSSGKPEGQILRDLDKIKNEVFKMLPSGERLKAQQEFERMMNTKRLPAPTSDFQGTPLKLGKETQSTIDAREKDLQKTYKKMSPKLLINREKGLLKSQNPLYKEPYKKTEEMPSIQVGSKPKKKDNLPIIKY